MMRLFPAVLWLLLASDAIAQECSGHVSRVRDIKEVGEFYSLFVRDDRGIPYTVTGDCVKLYGGAFRGTLTFAVRNRFPSFASQPVGILKAKSLRTFVTDSGPRIKVSRTVGWYSPAPSANGTRASMPGIYDREVKLKPIQWNDFHSKFDSASELNSKLNTNWHGSADEEGVLASVDANGFWSFNSTDSQKQVLTNYLIRFDTAKDGETIEFYTEVPSGVRRIDLAIDSNMELARGSYTFIIED
jgi:hypothetical protein